MNKIVLISSLVILGAVAIFFTLGGEKEKGVEKVATKKVEKQNIEDKVTKDNEPRLKDKIVKKESKKQELAETDNLVIVDNKEEELEELHREYSFEPIPIAELEQEIPYRKFVNPISAVAMPKDGFRNLHVGNKINFLDIEGMNYSIQLKGVQPMNGSNSFFAEVDTVDGVNYPTIVTVGNDGSGYIHLSTSKGIYEIELKDGKGYVYRSKDIHKALGDENKPDFLVKKQTENID